MKKAPPNEAVARYIERLEALYKTIEEEWLPSIDPDATTTHDQESLDEELSGAYEAPSMDIRLSSGSVVHFLPRGCYVIAASGRLDVESELGRETVVYFERPPSIESAANSMHRIWNPNDEGWAWVRVRNHKSHDFPMLTRETFERLIGILSE